MTDHAQREVRWRFKSHHHYRRRFLGSAIILGLALLGYWFLLRSCTAITTSSWLDG